MSLLWPMAASAGPVVAGDHEFVVETDGTAIADVFSVHKTMASSEAQQLDLQIWDATTTDAAAEQRGGWEVEFREFGEATLRPHGLAVGTIAFADAPDAIMSSHSTIDDSSPAQALRLCRELSDLVDGERVMNIVLVDASIDADNPDMQSTGSATGVPGAYPFAGSSTSCAYVVAPSPDPDTPIEQTLWHEAGHTLGLFHTSEAGGDSFDTVDDTARSAESRRSTSTATSSSNPTNAKTATTSCSGPVMPATSPRVRPTCCGAARCSALRDSWSRSAPRREFRRRRLVDVAKPVRSQSR